MKKFFAEVAEWLAMVFVAALAVRVAFDVIDGVWDGYTWCKNKIKAGWRNLRKKGAEQTVNDKKEKKDDKKKKK